MPGLLGNQNEGSDQLRRAVQPRLPPSESFALGPFVLDATAKLLLLDGTPVALGERAVAVLLALVRRAGQLVTKDQLMTEAWNSLAVEESNLTVQISSLRRALGAAPGGDAWIATMPRRGYRFRGPVSEVGLPARPPDLPSDKPSIAVLPFQNLSGDPDQDYFADGMVEDIITTGLSSRECLSAIKGHGGVLVGAACLIDRSGGRADIGVDRVALAVMDIPTYEADALPPELARLPPSKPGSRGLAQAAPGAVS